MKVAERIEAFVKLGDALKNRDKYINISNKKALGEAIQNLETIIQNEHIHNPWFIPVFVGEALKSIVKMLTEENLRKWTTHYPLDKKHTSNRIAVIMAGNIPMVGFHDFLCVLLAGDVFIGKLSSNDKHLLPALAKILCCIEPRFTEFIHFTETKLPEIDRIIATGSNNSARYFEYYFSKYPGIIRKHCNSTALLDGTENKEELSGLADDICLYFGLGCRSVSKLYVPEGYNFVPLFECINKYKDIYEKHHAYLNNLEYQKTIHLINKIAFYDQGILMFKENTSLASAISVVHYSYYKDKDKVLEDITCREETLQCVLSNHIATNQTFRLGQSQFPQIWKYANNIDTLAFLIKET